MKKTNFLKILVLVFFVLVSGILFCCGQAEPAEEYLLEGSLKENLTEALDGQTLKEKDTLEAETPDGEMLKEKDALEVEMAGRSSEPQQVQGKEPETVTAYIHGCVKKPGVYSLPTGSRLYELIEKAGGFSRKAREDAWNQAVPVEDGGQYKIPSKKEYQRNRNEEKRRENLSRAGSAGEEQKEISRDADGKVNLNTASREELLTLSGVGESKADAIISYREENGGFHAIEDIMNISGIKEGVFGRIKDKITTGEE